MQHRKSENPRIIEKQKQRKEKKRKEKKKKIKNNL